ncbi:MAG: BtrH N-terminal domain-containing protein [bacterium]
MNTKEKLIIKDFNYFGGKHCETAAIKHILDYRGLNLSEEMLLGLGGGIGFIYWYMKMMPAPFIGTRNSKVGDCTLNICKRIGAEAKIFQTSSTEKGHTELKKLLRQNEPAHIMADMAYFPYFAMPEGAHFGGHAVTVFGIDETENKVYIADRCKKAVTVTIDELKKARGSKFQPFAPKNKLLKIKYPSKIKNLEKGITGAINDCCKNMLNPPIKNIGFSGIQKWANLVPNWPKQFKGMNLLVCLFNTFMYIEIGGTGGSGFRPMYSKFLKEASVILNKPGLNEPADMFIQSAKLWTEIAESALPDSWPSLKRIKESMYEKNRLFEEYPEGAYKKMLVMLKEENELLENALEDVKTKDINALLQNLRLKILECYKIEEKTFEMLNKIIS